MHGHEREPSASIRRWLPLSTQHAIVAVRHASNGSVARAALPARADAFASVHAHVRGALPAGAMGSLRAP